MAEAIGNDKLSSIEMQIPRLDELRKAELIDARDDDCKK